MKPQKSAPPAITNKNLAIIIVTSSHMCRSLSVEDNFIVLVLRNDSLHWPWRCYAGERLFV